MSTLDAGGEADTASMADDEPVVDILTHGDPIRSFVTAARALDDTARLHIDSDGLRLRYADAANVGMVELEAPAEAFDRFEVTNDVTVGMNLKRLAGAVSNARKGRSGDGDPVTIEVFDSPDRIRVGVTRPDCGIKTFRDWFTLDIETMRIEPDLPDLSLPSRAEPTPKALKIAADNLNSEHDYARIRREDQKLVIENDNDDDDLPSDRVIFNGSAWSVDDMDGGTEGSLLSLDYLTHFTDALKAAKADRTTVSLGDEFPVRFDFEYEDWGFSGTYLLAPRIEEGDESEAGCR